MTDALTLNTAQPLPPAIAATAAEQTCCCAHLIERTQAVWNAFCAWITSWISSLFTWNAVPLLPPAPEPVLEPVPAAAPSVAPPAITLPLTAPPAADIPLTAAKAELTQEGLVAEYEKVFKLGVRLSTISGSAFHAFVEPLLSPEERAREIRGKIEGCELLHYVANPLYSDSTELLLKFGADPNRTVGFNFTPLHCAVLTGSFAAYRALRQHGANPWIRHWIRPPVGRNDIDHISKHTSIEIGYQILASNQTVADYFLGSYQDDYWDLQRCLPNIFRSKEHFGSLEEITKMIDCEVEQATVPIHATLGHLLPRPLSKIIAGYYLSGHPHESGKIMVQMYKEFHSHSQPGAMSTLEANPHATLEQQLQWIQTSVHTSNELFFASYHASNKQKNYAELFLALGANPNMRLPFGIHRAFTPLHAAVLTRSFETYKTLREWGGDPNARLGANEEGDSCIELATSMLPFKSDHPALYFNKFKEKAGFGKKTPLPAISPRIHFLADAGTAQDLEKIIAYEEERQLHSVQRVTDKIVQLWQITRPLATLIAQYGKYYI